MNWNLRWSSILLIKRISIFSTWFWRDHCVFLPMILTLLLLREKSLLCSLCLWTCCRCDWIPRRFTTPTPRTRRLWRWKICRFTAKILWRTAKLRFIARLILGTARVAIEHRVDYEKITSPEGNNQQQSCRPWEAEEAAIKSHPESDKLQRRKDVL